MLTTGIYNIAVDVGTRNHKGTFVRHTAYKLMAIEQSGWALICQDESICHYVDPDKLREIRHPAGSQASVK